MRNSSTTHAKEGNRSNGKRKEIQTEKKNETRTTNEPNNKWKTERNPNLRYNKEREGGEQQEVALVLKVAVTDSKQ